jgi:hypothetical protein
MSQCGCYISHSGYTPDEILYCPLHAASADLLEACRAMLADLSDHEPEECNHATGKCVWYDSLATVQAAIALVEGKS